MNKTSHKSFRRRVHPKYWKVKPEVSRGGEERRRECVQGGVQHIFYTLSKSKYKKRAQHLTKLLFCTQQRTSIGITQQNLNVKVQSTFVAKLRDIDFHILSGDQNGHSSFFLHTSQTGRNIIFILAINTNEKGHISTTSPTHTLSAKANSYSQDLQTSWIINSDIGSYLNLCARTIVKYLICFSCFHSCFINHILCP